MMPIKDEECSNCGSDGEYTFKSVESVRIVAYLCLGSRRGLWCSLSTLYPFLLVVCTIGLEMLAFGNMKIISNFYLAITSKDEALFIAVLKKSLIIFVATASMQTLRSYIGDMCALLWRKKTVSCLHHYYFATLHSMTESNVDGADTLISSNPEQRISQDVDKLTAELGQIFDKVVVNPALICFYSYYVWSILGVIGPLCCFVYFLLGALVSAILGRNLVEPLMNQESLEGSFRKMHSHLASNFRSLSLETEQELLEESFERVVLNSRIVVILRMYINSFVNIHSYLGSIGTYE